MEPKKNFFFLLINMEKDLTFLLIIIMAFCVVWRCNDNKYKEFVTMLTTKRKYIIHYFECIRIVELNFGNPHKNNTIKQLDSKQCTSNFFIDWLCLDSLQNCWLFCIFFFFCILRKSINGTQIFTIICFS